VSTRRLLDNLDVSTVVATLLLVGIGALGIASATLDQANEGLWRQQLIWMLLGSAAAAVVVVIDYRMLAHFAYVFHGAVVSLLVIVLFAGKEVAGNRSWLVVGGFQLQPSELAKWTTCLVLAAYLATRVRDTLGLRQLIEMGALVGVPMALVALQPDLGTALVFAPLYLAGIVLGGVRWKTVLIAGIIALLLAPIGWTQLKEYQKERILNVFDDARDPSGIGYQVRQSKIAIGSGGLAGKGLFRGTQSQLNYLPAQHTDFVLAVLAEELGFIGIAVVLGLFYYLLLRGVIAARSAQDRLGTYLCLLVVSWLTAQLAINIGMVLGRLPTIGVPLPLVSYGGSAMIAALCGVGLMVNVRTRRFVN
jgi:rod shape determining protein RodA